MAAGQPTSEAPGGAALDLAEVFARYSAAWVARDPDGIATLHHPDTVFWLHGGDDPSIGREDVRLRFRAIFERFPRFGVVTHRVLFGQRHWVLDWALTCVLPDSTGEEQRLQWDCLDVVTVDDAGLVLRKDTFVDTVQAAAALASLAR
jgi:uncharacterized protein (TIGR02246 family)